MNGPSPASSGVSVRSGRVAAERAHAQRPHSPPGRCARPRVGVAVALSALLGSVAPAPTALAAGELGDAARAALTRDRGFSAGSIADQLDRDPTLVPYGKGAIFVPAMTNPLDEPTVAVLSGKEVVAEGTTGVRIVLPPGEYEVRFGSGTERHRLGARATVVESHTTVLPVTWSGLNIHVVDEQFGSLRGSYELIRVADREYVGIGFGTDEQAGEPVTTWVLEPGLYKVVRVGENYRARRDFSTVRLVPGELTHFVLVLDPETGDLRGGGEIPEEEVFHAGDGWFGSLVLGGDVSMSSRSNVLGLADGLSFTVRAFADARATMTIAGSPLILRLQIEEGQTKSPDLPWLKSNDRTKLDALYVYQLYNWLGPYARAGGETNLLPGDQPFSTPVDIELEDESGATLSTAMDATSVRLSPSFGLTTLKEGAGINVRLFKTIWGETTVRTGLGARHRLTRDVFEAAPAGTATSSSALAYRRVPSTNQVGVEATVLASARVTRYVIINLELDTLVPFDSVGDVVLDIDGSIALKLTSYASVNYRLRFLRDPSLSQANVLQQDILLRFSLELL